MGKKHGKQNRNSSRATTANWSNLTSAWHPCAHCVACCPRQPSPACYRYQELICLLSGYQRKDSRQTELAIEFRGPGQVVDNGRALIPRHELSVIFLPKETGNEFWHTLLLTSIVMMMTMPWHIHPYPSERSPSRTGERPVLYVLCRSLSFSCC